MLDEIESFFELPSSAFVFENGSLNHGAYWCAP
jgi:hypothetical protein